MRPRRLTRSRNDGGARASVRGPAPGRGRRVIGIAVSADMLAATRFAVSPLMQAGAVLHPHRPHALSTVSVPRQQVDAVLQERQLPLLSALRREIAYRSGTLHLASEHRIEVSGTTDLTLFPSAVAHSWLISVDPWQERGIYLIYPTRSALGPDRMADGAAPPMGSVLGHSRSTLLAGPRSAPHHHPTRRPPPPEPVDGLLPPQPPPPCGPGQPRTREKPGALPAHRAR